MCYLKNEIKTPKYYILGVFTLLILSYLILDIFYNKKYTIHIITAILVQVSLLYLMTSLYKNYFQVFLKHSILPIEFEYSKFNLSLDFKEPRFQKSIYDKLPVLCFHGFFSNEYFTENLINNNSLHKEIRSHVNAVWKSTLLHFNVYKKYLAYILIYCFIFGLFILFSFILSNYLIHWELFDKIYFNLYKFFTFITFSFWLYVTILILMSEALMKLSIKKQEHNLYTIFNNTYILLDLEQEKRIEKSNTLIETYINISSGILYVSFLTALTLLI